MKTGFVVSDLHLLSGPPRDRGGRSEECVDLVYGAASEADFFVFNGDTFDFRWTSRPSVEAAVGEAARWLEELSERFPSCHFHVVLGNHDYHRAFQTALAALERRTPNLSWHAFYLRLGANLFLHGDVTNRTMDEARLARYRARWLDDGRKPAALHRLYGAVMALRADRLILGLLYPRRRVLRRVGAYVESLPPEVRNGVEHVYFGHTHRAFSDCVHGRRSFHNTGSAVRNAVFNMRRVELSGGR